jgi:allantoinase
VMPGNLNDRVSREHARIPNVRNWAVRDYGNRVGIWRIMEVLSRYGIRASAALNSEVWIIIRRSSRRPAGSAGS